MKKRLIFEVEEGVCHCAKCPFGVVNVIYNLPQYSCASSIDHLSCKKYDLATLKFIGEDEKDSKV